MNERESWVYVAASINSLGNTATRWQSTQPDQRACNSRYAFKQICRLQNLPRLYIAATSFSKYPVSTLLFRLYPNLVPPGWWSS